MVPVDDDALAAGWHELMGRYQRLTCALDRELQAGHGLSASEFEVLQQLSHAPDHSLRMSELAESAHVSQSALSRLVSRLEVDGLLQRSACTQDRRSLFVELTALGVTRYDEARPTQRRVLREDTQQAGGCLQRE
ncbi:MarR family transcriptional regulator [Lapillicoccus sp.]|uniref:MarR family winged helix-turn-helix transcriptional regulator n=1 Tax=Lapillicoccus sp. TaxID=1909287 RepID=UPI0025FD7F4E|nr:MarR family transcriptional regulator [Lapillicoccus sp.]